jgi:hypothetical protein
MVDNKKIEIPEEDVKIKISTCKKCNGIIRTAVEHMMSMKSKREFSKEAFEYDLAISTISLIEYRASKIKWCDCD